MTSSNRQQPESLHEPEYLHGSDPTEQARLEALAKMLGGAEFLPPLIPGMRVLEVGCGTGAITREVAGRVAPGTVVGVDRQEAQLQTAAELAAKHGVGNMRFVHGDAGELDFDDGEFDAAYCRFLLEHVASPGGVVREMARVAKPGGWVCAFEWENGCAIDYPDSPAVDQVWQAMYRLQDEIGGDSRIARKLYGLFIGAGLSEVQAKGSVWTVTTQDQEKLRFYVDGALEIIRQTQQALQSRGLATQALIDQARDEYRRLLEHPATYVCHGFCCAVGRTGDVSSQ